MPWWNLWRPQMPCLVKKTLTSCTHIQVITSIVCLPSPLYTPIDNMCLAQGPGGGGIASMNVTGDVPLERVTFSQQAT
jgi:hypothetical protein